jgi:hypothetical protein
MKFIENLTEGLLIASGLLVPFISLVITFQIIKGIFALDTILRVLP